LRTLLAIGPLISQRAKKEETLLAGLDSFFYAILCFYAFALFLRTLDFTVFAIRGNFQGFQDVKKFLQKCQTL